MLSALLNFLGKLAISMRKGYIDDASFFFNQGWSTKLTTYLDPRADIVEIWAKWAIIELIWKNNEYKWKFKTKRKKCSTALLLNVELTAVAVQESLLLQGSLSSREIVNDWIT